MVPDHREEGNYRALIDQSPNAIVVQSEGRVLFVNAAAMALVGATDPAQMVGQSVVKFVHADSLAKAQHRLAELDRTGRVASTTVRITRLDGTSIEVESMSSPVRFGDVEATQAVLRDVTDRFTLERERHARGLAEQNEAQFRLLSEAIPQIVWTATPDGSIDYYNQRWFDYTGLTLKETRGWGWELVLHPDDLELCIDRWRLAYTTGEPYEVEYRFRRASDGAYRWHLGRAMPVRDETGAIVKWFGTCTDIDDQKRPSRRSPRVSRGFGRSSSSPPSARRCSTSTGAPSKATRPMGISGAARSRTCRRVRRSSTIPCLPRRRSRRSCAAHSAGSRSRCRSCSTKADRPRATKSGFAPRCIPCETPLAA